MKEFHCRIYLRLADSGETKSKYVALGSSFCLYARKVLASGEPLPSSLRTTLLFSTVHCNCNRPRDDRMNALARKMSIRTR